MNRMAAVICIFILLVGFIGFHFYQIRKLDKDVSGICEKIEEDFDENNWQAIQNQLDQLQQRWNKSRFWACLTIDTAQIEEIEISMRQSMKYAQIGTREDFIGEFIMLQMQMKHLPHQEGFSIEELL